MTLPNFSYFGKTRLLNKLNFETWRDDYPATKLRPSPDFHRFDLGNGNWVENVITEAEFMAWLNKKAE